VGRTGSEWVAPLQASGAAANGAKSEKTVAQQCGEWAQSTKVAGGRRHMGRAPLGARARHQGLTCCVIFGLAVGDLWFQK
jgi:hypothetical protein